jgi:hypothetical protein
VAGSKVIAKDGQGKRRSISKFEAALTQLLNQAASGDLRAIRMMITLAEGIEAKSEQTNLPEITLTEADRPPARPHQLVEFLPGEDLRHQPSLAGALFDVDMPSR